LSTSDNGTPVVIEYSYGGVTTQDSTDNLTVNPATAIVTTIAVKTQPTKLIYINGDSLDLSGLVVTLTYDNGSTPDVPFASFGTTITVNPTNKTPLTTATHNGSKITVSYGTSGTITDQTAALTVKTVTNIAVKTQPTKLTYDDGDGLDLTGLVVTLTYSDASTEDVALANLAANHLTTTPPNGATLGTSNSGSPVVIGYSYAGVTKQASTNNLTVNPATATVTDIAIKTQPKLIYKQGDSLDLSSMVVTLTYSSGSPRDVAYSDFVANHLTATPDDGTPLTIVAHNGKPVTVEYSYGGITKQVSTNNLTVTEIPITIAAITVTAPKTGIAPNKTATGDTAKFIASDVTWSPNDNPFLGSTKYTATVTLTANPGYTFTGIADSNATINGYQDTVVNTGGTLKLSYEFPATSPAQSPVVTDITVITPPTKMTYTDGEQLDLSGLEVRLKYSDNKTEDVVFANFAARRITTNPLNGTTLNSLIHNNGCVEVIYTYNNTNVKNCTGDKLKVSKKVIPTIAIGGEMLKPDSPDGNEFTYVSQCGEDNINMGITQANAEITVDGDIVQDSLNKPLSDGDNRFGIRVTPQDTRIPEYYWLIVKKPFPAEQMIKRRWGNTLTIIDNSRDNPYEFTNYKWYRNGREVGSGRSWSAGTNGEKLNPKDTMHVEGTTEEGKVIRSCKITAGVTQQEYGILLKNNSASANIGIEVFAPEASEVEIAVYDIAGKQVFKQKGNYAFHWNLTDTMQRRVSNGLYFVTAKAKGESGKLYRYSAKLVVKK